MTPYSLIFSMCSFRIQLRIITKQIKRLFFSYIVNHINIIHCFFLFLNFVAFFHLIEIFFEVSILTLWLLRGEEGEGGDTGTQLCPHLFGLVFPIPTSRKMSVGSTAPSPSPPHLPALLILRLNFLKLCF